MLLTVQRKWMYLESIFMAAGDINKQLPEESALFVRGERHVQGDHDLGSPRTRTRSASARSRACSTAWARWTTSSRSIQKSLDQYLETKRMVFPRFYFVSDDDLLEILGQSRDPPAVQKHIKKCFEGFKKMDVIPPGKQVNRNFECSGMVSPEGETAPFVANVVLDGAVELWLGELEKAMFLGMQKLLAGAIAGFKGKKEKWIKTGRASCSSPRARSSGPPTALKALVAIAGGSKNAMKQTKKKQIGFLNRMAEMIRNPLPKIVRKRLVALITMEIHNRDVMEKMIKAKCAATSGLRVAVPAALHLHEGRGPVRLCGVRQTNCVLEYGYEYQGNNGRLVVTPLTDRCIFTLLTANVPQPRRQPARPAGTGKTETVKDLGKNLAKYVVVINCSDGHGLQVGRPHLLWARASRARGAASTSSTASRSRSSRSWRMQVLSIVNALNQQAQGLRLHGPDDHVQPELPVSSSP